MVVIEKLMALPQLEHPNLKTGIMENWNDGVRRKTKNLSFSILIPITPLFQQSIIPISQKIPLRDKGVPRKITKLEKHNYGG
jgi:hypothetical protein